MVSDLDIAYAWCVLVCAVNQSRASRCCSHISTALMHVLMHIILIPRIVFAVEQGFSGGVDGTV